MAQEAEATDDLRADYGVDSVAQLTVCAHILLCSVRCAYCCGENGGVVSRGSKSGEAGQEAVGKWAQAVLSGKDWPHR